MAERLRMKPTDQLEPTVFVIFGGAGDLTWRKLVPALFDLSQDRSVPANYSIIAVDRVDLSDEKLRQRLHDGVRKFSRRGMAKPSEWAEFARHIRYQQGDFKKLETYRALGEAGAGTDGRSGAGEFEEGPSGSCGRAVEGPWPGTGHGAGIDRGERGNGHDVGDGPDCGGRRNLGGGEDGRGGRGRGHARH